MVILNYNGWWYTVAALESVLRQEYANYVVVISDNGSTDGSVEHISAWANGDERLTHTVPEVLFPLLEPPVPKPVAHQVLDADTLDFTSHAILPESRLFILKKKKNEGFSRGMNVGLRWSIDRGDLEYAWLLNNDVIVDPIALRHLVEYQRANPRAGLIGPTVRQMQDPDRIQCCGGNRFNWWLARGSPLGEGRSAAVDINPARLRLDYVCGAAMFTSKAFLREIGVIPEHHFLYFEEVSWALAARGRYSLGWAQHATVFHHEGATTGIGRRGNDLGNTSDFLLYRNRLVFTRRTAPWRLPTVYLGLVVAVVKALATWRLPRVRMFFRWALWSWPTRDERLTEADVNKLLGRSRAHENTHGKAAQSRSRGHLRAGGAAPHPTPAKSLSNVNKTPKSDSRLWFDSPDDRGIKNRTS